VLPNDTFQQQLANLQQSYAQLGQMMQPPPVQPLPVAPLSESPDGVDGIEGAREYLGRMAPSTKRYVWDNQADRFYFLQKDANGKAARIMIGDFTLTPEPSMEDRYVTRDDFNALVAKIDLMLSQKGTVDNG